MNEQDKAKVQQAIDAFAVLKMNDYSGYECSKHETDKIDDAETALRQLLEAEPVQEPVAWMNPHGGFLSASYIDEFASGLDKEIHNIPLYTTPPIVATPLAQPASQHSENTAWVDLSVEQKMRIHYECEGSISYAIELTLAKLREKNGY